MKDKQTFLMKGSFALLLFVILGYMVKFYPETLVGFDQPIQTAVRGDLPDYLTILFRAITRLIDIPVIITWVVIIAFVFYRTRWKIESFFMLGNLALAGLLIVIFKNIYQRPRPAILHLVEEKGFSFPSGHSLAVTLMVGSLIVILSQRIKKSSLEKNRANRSRSLPSQCVGIKGSIWEFITHQMYLPVSVWAWESCLSNSPSMTSSASNGDLKASRSEYQIPLRRKK